MMYHCGHKGDAIPLCNEQDLLALKPRAVFLLIPKDTQLSSFLYVTAPIFDHLFSLVGKVS